MANEVMKLYTVQDVMSFLNVCDETVYRWINSGKLKAVRVGGQWRIRHDELKRFIGEK